MKGKHHAIIIFFGYWFAASIVWGLAKEVPTMVGLVTKKTQPEYALNVDLCNVYLKQQTSEQKILLLTRLRENLTETEWKDFINYCYPKMKTK